MVDISNFTAAKILDKRPSPFRFEYRCESEPLWLIADLVEKVKMGRVHIRSYENGLIQANRLGTLRGRKRKLGVLSRRQYNFCDITTVVVCYNMCP